MHNRIKDQSAAGKPAFGAQLRFGSPAIAELFGHSGFDFLVIDSEHAPQTPTGIQAQLQAIGNTPATPIVRLPRIDEEQTRLYLDMGALGILAPFVNTAAQAAEGARACRYPPTGIRGFGPHRAAQYGLRTDEYFAEINDLVVFIALIETAEAVANIDEILAVDGVDTFVIGPVDLSFRWGCPLTTRDLFSKTLRPSSPQPLAALASPLVLGSIARPTTRKHSNAPWTTAFR